jgi:hypothetical protein
MTAAKKPADRAHPFLKFLYLQMKVEGVSLRATCEKAGVSYNTAKDAMQGRSNISLASTEALLNTIGYSMKPTPLYEVRA